MPFTYEDALKQFYREYHQIWATGTQDEIRFAWEQMLDDLCPFTITSTLHQKWIHQCPIK